MPRIFVIAMALVLLMLFFAPAAAQDDVLIETEAPDPSLCTLDPRTVEEIRELVAAGTPTPAETPTPVPDPFVMPEGDILQEEVRDEVEKDLLRAVGCFNTGDPLKVFATYTDAYVVELIDRLGGLNDEIEAVLGTVQPLESSQYIVVLAILDAMILDDGRVLIVVSGYDPTDDAPPGPRLFYLEEVLPGRWLIDEVFAVELG